MSDATPPNLRILKIFEIISDAGRPLTPTEINEQLCWPKQSLHRLCQTLIIEGYLVKQARDYIQQNDYWCSGGVNPACCRPDNAPSNFAKYSP